MLGLINALGCEQQTLRISTFEINLICHLVPVVCIAFAFW